MDIPKKPTIKPTQAGKEYRGGRPVKGATYRDGYERINFSKTKGDAKDVEGPNDN